MIKRGARMIRTNKKAQVARSDVVARTAQKKAVKQGHDDPYTQLPRNTVYNGLGFSGVHSVTTYCNVVRFNYPGITEDNNNKPLFCSSNYLEIYNSAPADSEIAWDDVSTFESTDGQHESDNFFDYYVSKDGILANVFENGGCLFLYKEGTNEVATTESPNCNYVYLIKPKESEEEGDIDYREQTIYINCDGFEEVKEGEKIKEYLPINPRTVRVYGVNASKVTFKFYSFTIPEEEDEEYPHARDLQILKKAYHWEAGTSESDKKLGKGEIVEGAPNGGDTPDDPDNPDDPDDETDPFAPVDEEGEVIEGAERIVNEDTNDETFNETVEIDGKTYSLRGAFPVTKLIESADAEGAEGDLDRIYEDNAEVKVEKYVMLYYIPNDKTVEYVLGNHFTVEDNEAVMLYKRIELYPDIVGGLKDVVDRCEKEEYTFNLLYYNYPETSAEINQYHEMKYKNLLIDTFVNSNIERVDGTLHIYKYGLLTCRRKLKNGRFETLNLYVNKDKSIIYPDGQLKCSDVVQIEM